MGIIKIIYVKIVRTLAKPVMDLKEIIASYVREHWLSMCYQMFAVMLIVYTDV